MTPNDVSSVVYGYYVEVFTVYILFTFALMYSVEMSVVVVVVKFNLDRIAISTTE